MIFTYRNIFFVAFSGILSIFILVVPLISFAQVVLPTTAQIGLTSADPEIILAEVITQLFLVLGALAVLVIVIAGIYYIVSGGDESRTTLARKAITYAVGGLAVAILGYAIVNTIAGGLGADNTAIGLDAGLNRAGTTTSISGGLVSIITIVLGIVGSLSVLIVVIAGIMYMTSGGDEGKTTTARKALTYAIVGLAVAIFGWIIVNTVSSGLGANVSFTAESEYNGGAGDVSGAIGSILQVILGIIGAVAVLIIVISGIMYMTSGGDEGKTTNARRTLTYAIVGLIVALLGWVIVNTVVAPLSCSVSLFGLCF